MTIYQDSKRIVGTNADRVGVPAVSGGWKELGRTTLGSGGSDITVSSLPNKRYYMYLINPLPSASNNSRMRFNSDSGSNYSIRRSENGASDTTLTSRTETRMDSSATDANKLIVGYISNLAGKEKLTLSHLIKGGSTGAAPSREEDTCKWVNTSNAIDEITTNTGSGSYPTGSEVVVLGYDPADTHTTNFWEELDSVTLSSANASLDSNTFTAKKYLWIQLALIPNSTDSIGVDMQINSDTGTNYPFRRSTNGGADGAYTAFNEFTPYPNSGNYPIFVNMFWINNASNEKLGIAHSVSGNTAGAGTAPERREDAMKWANTSNQITSLQFGTNTAGQFGIGSTLKVWGSN